MCTYCVGSHSSYTGTSYSAMNVRLAAQVLSMYNC